MSEQPNFWEMPPEDEGKHKGVPKDQKKNKRMKDMLNPKPSEGEKGIKVPKGPEDELGND